MKSVAIIGGGAAGCFCAVNLKRMAPQLKITIYEAQNKLLAKVAITGGGRCNITNTFNNYKDAGGKLTRLEEVYPRGTNLMKRLLMGFNNEDTLRWFEELGVRFTAQEDECIFPKSQDAMEIVNTLQREIKRLGIEVVTGKRITDIDNLKEDIKVVTAGGGKNLTFLSFLKNRDLEIEPLHPSLFTFEIKEKELTQMSGTVVENAKCSIPSTRFKSAGPLLITDWGLSGPAILKLSSYGAVYLAENNYNAPLSVNWLGKDMDSVIKEIKALTEQNPQKKLSSVAPKELTQRLWSYIIKRAQIREDIRCNELGSKGLNKLANTLFADSYKIEGKGRFKEEFVTAGGVSLKEINSNTLRSKKYEDLYFAGEVLNIDAITGGFNLQAAWTTGYTVARAIASL